MRLPRLVLPLLTVTLALAAAPAVAEPPLPPLPPTPPVAPRVAPAWSGQPTTQTAQAQRAERATRALEAVAEAFAPKGSAAATRTGVDRVDVTLLLLDLRRRYADLTPSQQRVASAYLARPTGSGEPFGATYARTARPVSDCVKRPTKGSHVCITWARRTSDAPPLADRDRDGIPNQVEKTRNVMNHVWKQIVTRGGYRAPLPDKRGPDNRLDVYLADIGDAGVYGYCNTESPKNSRQWTGYCVLDDDYRRGQFPAHSPTKNLKVTAAHEFFHAVQFSYDALEDSWFMESTATWIEDEIYDGVNDNRFYLNQSAMSEPELALDDPDGLLRYGNWIWWRFLTERVTDGSGGLPVLVREAWEAAAGNKPGHYSMAALDTALANRGLDLGQLLAQFATANRRPDAALPAGYEEGRFYRPAPLAETYRLGPGKPSSGEHTATLWHMASTTVAFRPDDDEHADPSWQLRIDIDGPSETHRPVVQVTVVPRSGDAVTQFVPLSVDGGGSVAVPFSSSQVQRVELTLTNAGRAYDCNRGTRWSCGGDPLDKKQQFRFAATSFR